MQGLAHGLLGIFVWRKRGPFLPSDTTSPDLSQEYREIIAKKIFFFAFFLHRKWYNQIVF